MWLQGQEVSVGGIGEVSTKKEFSGRGYASKLLHVMGQMILH